MRDDVPEAVERRLARVERPEADDVTARDCMCDFTIGSRACSLVSKSASSAPALPENEMTTGLLNDPELAKELKHPWRRLLLTSNELLVHFVGVLAILATMRALEFLMNLSPTEPVLFRGLGVFECKVIWFLDAAEVGIVVSYGYQSVVQFKKALSR